MTETENSLKALRDRKNKREQSQTLNKGPMLVLLLQLLLVLLLLLPLLLGALRPVCPFVLLLLLLALLMLRHGAPQGRSCSCL